MELKQIYPKEDKTYADFFCSNEGVGIEFDEDTHKVLDLHFSIMIEADKILKFHNYISDENQNYYYDSVEKMLSIPIKKLTA